MLDNLRAASRPARHRLLRPRPGLAGERRRCRSTVLSAIRSSTSRTTSTAQVEDLPYGQRRLLAIARAVATQPSVLLLDEPAAGLGDVETAELAHLVRRLAKEWGIAVLLVEHDMNFVMSVCDELVVLDFGRQIAAGTPDDGPQRPGRDRRLPRRGRGGRVGRLGPQRAVRSGAVGTEETVMDRGDLESRACPPATPASRSSTTSTSTVDPGEVVCLLGPNGAGKTTTLLALAGELPLISGEVAVRRRQAEGAAATSAPATGMSYVTEERSVFKGLTPARQPAGRRRRRRRSARAVPRARASG